MLLKIAKTTVLLAVTAATLNAGSFNAQAEKDRKALVKYTIDRFSEPVKNQYSFFPYNSEKELAKWNKVNTAEGFVNGTYAYDYVGKISRDDMMEMPPFEEDIEKGEAAYNAHFKSCFPNPAIAGDYPKFNEKTGKVDTLSEVIVACAKKAKLKTGKKGYNLKGGKTANLQAYFAYESQEAEKKINIQINSKAAADAYANGRDEFYTQRGYLELSCASCHVQGAGQRVRLQYLSQTLGHTTHFPVYRTGKGKMFTLEGRLGGCNRNMGEAPHKPGSDWSSDVLYFMSYMNNGLPLTGPDVRR
jgi:sulfur-oxidizing protein SoxA